MCYCFKQETFNYCIKLFAKCAPCYTLLDGIAVINLYSGDVQVHYTKRRVSGPSTWIALLRWIVTQKYAFWSHFFFWMTHKFEFLVGKTLTKWNIKVYNLGADQKASSTTFDVTIYIQSLLITGTSWVRISTIGTLFRKRGFVFFISPCNQSTPQPLLSTLWSTCVIYPTLLVYREFIWKSFVDKRISCLFQPGDRYDCLKNVNIGGTPVTIPKFSRKLCERKTFFGVKWKKIFLDFCFRM